MHAIMTSRLSGYFNGYSWANSAIPHVKIPTSIFRQVVKCDSEYPSSCKFWKLIEGSYHLDFPLRFHYQSLSLKQGRSWLRTAIASSSKARFNWPESDKSCCFGKWNTFLPQPSFICSNNTRSELRLQVCTHAASHLL